MRPVRGIGRLAWSVCLGLFFCWLAGASTATSLAGVIDKGYAGSWQFDETATSAAVIAGDPDLTIGLENQFVANGTNTTTTGPFTGTDINSLVGADRFYTAGRTGTNAVVANIESGYIYNGHETLSHVSLMPAQTGSAAETDRHGTWVGMLIGGRQGGSNPGIYQEGIAPDAELHSGAVASSWVGSAYSVDFNVTLASFFDTYRDAFEDGITGTGGKRTADVINSSFGGGDPTGTGILAVGLDGLINVNPRTLLISSAGNNGAGPDSVRAPATAYNNIAVASLGPNPTFNAPSSFSSGGPNDYSDPVNGTTQDARQVIDIAAPGEQISTAYYGGQTGGNGPGLPGSPSGVAGGPDYYSLSKAGTSFSAPTIAGGAALLYDAAYADLSGIADARDARVVKAVLMNSAEKTSGWDNGQTAHANGNGGVMTTQGLDNRVGTGRIDLDGAYDQFLAGTTDVSGTGSGNLGMVEVVGWDFGVVGEGTPNDYIFDESLDGGSTFTATLTWFRDRSLSVLNTGSDDSYDDLDLELWEVVSGSLTNLISESSSPFNSSEHFSFAIPQTADYALRVRWDSEVFDLIGDANNETYGVAWSGTAAVVGNVHTWITAAVSEIWGTAGNWDAAGVPAANWEAIVQDTQVYNQTAVVSANSTVDKITISGLTNAMTVHVQSGVDLAATTEVVINALGVARVDGTLATGRIDVNTGGSVRAELATPGVDHITANDDVNIAAGAALTIDSGTPPAGGAHLFHILLADADNVGGNTVNGTFDTLSLPGDDGLGRRYSVLYENRAADGVGIVDTVKVGLARPGDADFNSAVDALDLLAASPFFDTTTPANWRQGNWNDTGGSQGVVDAIDLLDASPFFSQTYGGGELLLGGDVTTPGQGSDGNPSITYDYTTGEILIDTDGNTTNTYVLDSLAGIFSGLPANLIGGTFFQTDNDFRIAENFHTNLAGVHNLGAVAQTGLTLGFLLSDLTLQGGSAGNPNFKFDLIVRNTPEPSTLVLLVLGLVGFAGVARRRGHRRDAGATVG